MKRMFFTLGLTLASVSSAAFADTTRIPNFQAYCDRVSQAFNTTATGRLIPFKFINYQGYEQSSESIVQVIGSSCVGNVTDHFFNIRRTNGADINFFVAFKSLGNDTYEVLVEGSDCERKFYDYAIPRMKEAGLVVNDEFLRRFNDNNRLEYCPKFEKAVSQELIHVIQSIP